jgi:hypothetical protein
LRAGSTGPYGYALPASLLPARFLSAFPGEAEILFPPLTFLKPTGRKLQITHHAVTFTVIEVEPHG